MISLLEFSFLALAASASLSFGQTPSLIPVGKEFKVPIIVSSAGQTTLGTDVVILFDPKVLQVAKVKPGSAYPTYPLNLKDIDNAHGKIWFSGTVGFGPPQPAAGLFGSFFFRAKKVGTTKISFDWEPGGTDDSNIVTDSGVLDILREEPKELILSFREASQLEKLWAFIQRALPFITR